MDGTCFLYNYRQRKLIPSSHTYIHTTLKHMHKHTQTHEHKHTHKHTHKQTGPALNNLYLFCAVAAATISSLREGRNEFIQLLKPEYQHVLL